MHAAIDPPEQGRRLAGGAVAGAALAAVAGLGWVVAGLPDESAGPAGAVAGRLAESGLDNAVNAVLINFRAFDTLLEKAVLVLALVGIWALVPEAALARPSANLWSRRPAEPQLTFLLKILVPVALLTAVYLFWHGAEAPGGAFQAGTMLAAIAILLVLSRVLPPPTHAAPALRWSVVAGFLLFAGIGAATALAGAGFLDYPVAWAKPLIVAIEAGLTLSVAATLLLQASGLPRLSEPASGPERAGGR